MAKKPTTNWFKRQFQKLKQRFTPKQRIVEPKQEKSKQERLKKPEPKLKQNRPINLGKVRETYKQKPSTPKVAKPSTPKPTKPKETPQPKPKKPKATKYTPPVEGTRPKDKINENESFFADTVIKNYRAEIMLYPSNAGPKLNAWLDRLLIEYSKTDVATMLQQGAEEGHVLTNKIAYDDLLLEGYVSDMLNYLPEMTEWEKSDIIDDFDNWVQDV